MAAVDLIFNRTLKTGNPVELVFGDEGGGGQVPDKTLVVAARMPGLRVRSLVHVRKDLVAAGRMPGLRCSAVVRYNTDTPRPVVAEVAASAQQAQPVAQGWVSGWQDTDALPAGWTAAAQDAMPLQEQFGVAWQDGQRQGVALQGRFQQARPLPGAATQARWQEAQDLRVSLQATAQDAVPVRAGWAVRFQESLRDRRRMVEATAQDAMGLQYELTTGAGPAVPLYRSFEGRYQQAMKPPAGKSQAKPPEPEKPGCYEQLIGGPIKLVFCKSWSASADLVFYCCQSTPEPGSQFVIPLLKVYMLVYQSNAVLLPSGTPVPLTGVRIESGDDGFGWTLSASGPVDLVGLLAPQGGVPQQIRLTINGIDWVFAVKQPVRSRSFDGWEASVSGQSVTSLIGERYWRAKAWSISSQMSVQQIASEALQNTGITLDWGAEDWQVPAAAWSHTGTPLSVIKRIAEAAGAVVRSHRTEPVLQLQPEYKALPWNWASAVPDVVMPGQIIVQDTLTDLEQELRNAVYVSGSAAGGVVGQIVRAGTAGDLLAAQITDPLMTDVIAVRQRGIVPLADSALRWRQEVSVPLITGGTAPGLILPGYLIEVQEPGETWRGLVRHLSLDENMPEFTQTLTVDRYQ